MANMKIKQAAIDDTELRLIRTEIIHRFTRVPVDTEDPGKGEKDEEQVLIQTHVGIGVNNTGPNIPMNRQPLSEFLSRNLLDETATIAEIETAGLANHKADKLE